MGDHDHRLAELVEDLLQLVLQLVPHHRVERAQRLVQQQRVGVGHQRAHQRHALALTAGQFGRIALQHVRRQVGQRGELFRALADPLAIPPKVARQQGQVAQRGEVRKQAAVLDHVADPPTQRQHVGALQGLAVDLDMAVVRPLQPEQQAQHGGLARAAAADQRGGGAGSERQGDLFERLQPAVALARLHQCEGDAAGGLSRGHGASWQLDLRFGGGETARAGDAAAAAVRA